MCRGRILALIAALSGFCFVGSCADDSDGGDDGTDAGTDTDTDADTDADIPDPDPAAPFAVMELFTSES